MTTDQMKSKQKENEFTKLIDHLNGQLLLRPAKKQKGGSKSKGLLGSNRGNFNFYGLKTVMGQSKSVPKRVYPRFRALK